MKTKKKVEDQSSNLRHHIDRGSAVVREREIAGKTQKIMREKWGIFLKQVKKVSLIAAPMAATAVLQYLFQVVSVMMVGRLGDELLLSGVSIATSFTSVTGYSLLFGLAGALETLCGQAYGAEQYQMLGIYTYTSTLSLLTVCLPVSVLWIFTENILKLIHQEPSISRVAGKYAISLIPNLYAYPFLQSLTRYFQTQSLTLPLFYSSFGAFLFHVLICWVLVFKLNLRNCGAALALGVSYWLNVVFLLFYMLFSSTCAKTRAQFSSDVIARVGEFFKFAVPSSVMVCLEWWSYEVLILLSGILPNPEKETSVLSICFAVTYLHYFIPYGFGATASTRVSNELGSGNPNGAKLAVKAIMVVAVAEMITVSITLFYCRHVLGFAFSSQKEIVDGVAQMAPLISISIIVDGLQAVLSGVARGSGWQQIGAYVNLFAYYGVGVPVGVVLAFVYKMGVKGLWIGLVTGSAVQALLLALITCSSNWQKQASKARARIFEGNSSQ